MTDLADVLAAVVRVMQTEFSIYGLTFSFWDIFLWSLVAGAIVFLIGWWLSD